MMTRESRLNAGDIHRRASLPSRVLRKSNHGESTTTLRQRVGDQGLRRLVGDSAFVNEGKSGRSAAIQAKLRISEPGDAHEREADRVAEEVMRMQGSSGAPSVSSTDVMPQRMCSECDEGKMSLSVLRKRETDRSSPTPRSPSANILGLGSGRALPASTRAFFEPRLGADFGDVRVHTDTRAQEAASSVDARAFTVGRDIAFAKGEYSPHSREGQRLLAHELTHVVQQSRSTGSVPDLLRDRPRQTSPAAKLEAAKTNLKTKYGLKDITEKGGVVWTESRLRELDTALSKMSKEEQKRLQGVTIILVDKFPSKTVKGRTFPIAGQTFGTHSIELTPAGLRGTVLHEAGHLIHHAAIAHAKKIVEGSPIKAALEAARNDVTASGRKPFRVSQDEQQNFAQIQAIVTAAGAFERSSDKDRAANRTALEEAEMLLLPFTTSPDAKLISAHVDKLRVFVAALLKWGDEQERVVDPVSKLDEFVSIVKKHKLASRSFPAFTPYAEAHWPDQPAEFFAEAYVYWRKNPTDMKKKGRALFDWFEKGGHFGPKAAIAPKP